MKVFMIMRAYSHLTPSINSGKWNPHGMPAFCKLLEGLNKKRVLTDILLLSRLASDNIDTKKNIKFKQLENINFSVIKYKSWLKHWFDIRKQLKKAKYDVIYADRVHVFFAALLAFLGYRVVLRLHGVANLFELPFWRKGIFPSPELMSYSAPFSYVICSRDGSPGKSFTDKYLRKSVPREILLNGVDQVQKADKSKLREKFNISPQSKVILSSGRMDVTKSMDVFLNSLIFLLKQGENIVGFLVGGGDMLESLKKTVKKAGYTDRIFFTGQVPHQKMNEYLSIADIFVSLNLYGNLSNCVLEAMRAGKCIVTLNRCKDTFKDEQNDDSEELHNCLVLIDRDNISFELEAALKNLLKEPKQINTKADLIKQYAFKNLSNWNTRIDKEIEIMEIATENKGS